MESKRFHLFKEKEVTFIKEKVSIVLFFPVQKYSRVVDRNLEGYQKLYFSFFFYFFPNKSVFPLTIFFSKFFRKLVSKLFLFFLSLFSYVKTTYFFLFFLHK